MAQAINLLQCYVCQETLDGLRLWASRNCGHIYCERCAFKIFPTNLYKECAVCRIRSGPSALIQVYVDHGSYTLRSLIQEDESATSTCHNTDDQAEVPNEAFTLISNSTLLKEGRTAVELLTKLSAVAPKRWTTISDKNDKPFSIAGQFIESVSSKIDDKETKPIVRDIGKSVRRLQKSFEEILSLSRSNSNLHDQLSKLREVETQIKQTLREMDQTLAESIEIRDDLEKTVRLLREDLEGEKEEKRILQYELQGIPYFVKFIAASYRRMLQLTGFSSELRGVARATLCNCNGRNDGLDIKKEEEDKESLTLCETDLPSGQDISHINSEEDFIRLLRNTPIIFNKCVPTQSNDMNQDERPPQANSDQSQSRKRPTDDEDFTKKASTSRKRTLLKPQNDEQSFSTGALTGRTNSEQDRPRKKIRSDSDKEM